MPFPMSFNVQIPINYEPEIQMSPAAASILREFLDEVSTLHKPRILEFGTGASTIWYSKTWPDAEIVAVEGDKSWYEKTKPLLGKNVQYLYAEQNSNYRDSSVVDNPEYYGCCLGKGQFDLIINDGAMREQVGDFILLHEEELISSGGIYLRHDYEKAIRGEWIGQHLNTPYWLTDRKLVGYEQFCARNPKFSLLTVSGNGKWGYRAELGGVWKRP